MKCFLVRRPQILWIVCMLLLAGGCSRFDRDYKTALSSPIPVSSPEGPWVGSWLSDKNGHNGELRCLIEHQEGDTYIARFKARFWKIFTYTSEAELVMTPSEDGRVFSGEAELGWLAGGLYTYQGRVNATNFFSTYECKWDHGSYQMARPVVEAGATD